MLISMWLTLKGATANQGSLAERARECLVSNLRVDNAQLD